MASSQTLVPCLAALLLLFVSMMISFSEAKRFHIGGRKSLWEIPSSPEYYNRWAAKKRFNVGDVIVMKYDGKTDSVLQVDEEDYKNCNKSNALRSYDDGNTRITLDKSGPFFFISGAEGHCEKGQKIEIRVLFPKHASQGNPPAAPETSPAAPETPETPAAPEPSPAVADKFHHSPAPAPHHAGGDVVKVGFLSGVFVVLGVFVALV